MVRHHSQQTGLTDEPLICAYPSPAVPALPPSENPTAECGPSVDDAEVPATALRADDTIDPMVVQLVRFGFPFIRHAPAPLGYI